MRVSVELKRSGVKGREDRDKAHWTHTEKKKETVGGVGEGRCGVAWAKAI